MPIPYETDWRFDKYFEKTFANANKRGKVKIFKDLVTAFLWEPSRADGKQAGHAALSVMALFKETPPRWLDEALLLSVAKLATFTGSPEREELALQARHALLDLTHRFPLLAEQCFRRASKSKIETTKLAAQHLAQALVKTAPENQIQNVWKATAEAAFDQSPSVREEGNKTLQLILQKDPDRTGQLQAWTHHLNAQQSLCVTAQKNKPHACALLEKTIPFLYNPSEEVQSNAHMLIANLVAVCPFLGNEDLLETTIRLATDSKHSCVREAAHESVRAQIRANKKLLSESLAKTLTHVVLLGKDTLTREAGLETLHTLLRAKPAWALLVWDETYNAFIEKSATTLRGALDITESFSDRDHTLVDGFIFNEIISIALYNKDADIRSTAQRILAPLMEKRDDLTGSCFAARLEESSNTEGPAAQSLLYLFVEVNAARAGSTLLARIGQRGLDTKLGWRTRVDAQTAFCAAMRNLVETDSTQLNADLVATLRDTALRAYNPARGEDALGTIRLIVQKRPDLADKDLAIFMRHMAKRGDTPHLCDLAEINLSLIESVAPDAARAAAPPRPSRGFPMACFG